MSSQSVREHTYDNTEPLKSPAASMKMMGFTDFITKMKSKRNSMNPFKTKKSEYQTDFQNMIKSMTVSISRSNASPYGISSHSIATSEKNTKSRKQEPNRRKRATNSSNVVQNKRQNNCDIPMKQPSTKQIWNPLKCVLGIRSVRKEKVDDNSKNKTCVHFKLYPSSRLLNKDCTMPPPTVDQLL